MLCYKFKLEKKRSNKCILHLEQEVSRLGAVLSMQSPGKVLPVARMSFPLLVGASVVPFGVKNEELDHGLPLRVGLDF